MGHHGVGNCIANGCMLLELCAGEGLIINNNQLQQKTRLKRTWQHWRSKHWHLLDYVLVCQEDLMWYIPESCPVLTATQTISWFRPKSDSTSRPLWEKEGQKSRSFTPTSCWREKLSLKRNSERDEQKEELPFRKTDLEHLCLQLKTIFQVAAEKEGGLSTRNYRKWFDENDTEIQKLFQAKRSCHITLLSRSDSYATKTTYTRACSYVEPRLTQIQVKLVAYTA